MTLGLSAGCDEPPRRSKTVAPKPVRVSLPSQLSPAPIDTSDAKVADAVRRALRSSRAVPAKDIKVGVVANVVQLSGSVPHLLAKRRAVTRAMLTRGVSSVVDLITVETPARPDQVVQRDVKNALILDPTTEGFQIETKVKDGVVTLSGKVESWPEKQLAERVAAGVRGVTKVDNDLVVTYATARSDAEIDRDVESRLRWDALVDATFVSASVKDGVVTLTGIVGSSAEKYQAAADAWVSGVKRVDNQLRVDWLFDHPDRRKSLAVDKSDRAIANAIRYALVLDPRVNSLAVKIDVNDGVVTLSGYVATLRARAAAKQAARHTVGVRRVLSTVVVRPDKPRADAEISINARRALRRNATTTSADIALLVERGHVRLSGTVDSYFEKAEAESVVGNLAGVTGVTNKLKVKLRHFPYLSSPYDPFYTPWSGRKADFRPSLALKSDVAIARDTRRNLRWDPFVFGPAVTVTVVGGQATLRGSVRDSRARHAAINAAYRAGAVKVVDKLRYPEAKETTSK